MASGLFKKKQNILNTDLKDLSVSEAALAQSTFNVEKITDIQSRFRGGEVLLVPGRIFIRDGALWKVCRKGPKKRQFFLFNDILVYGTIVSRGHYGNQHIMALKNMSVSSDCHYMPQVDLESSSGEGVVDSTEGGGASPSELKPENAFQVSHSDKSFHVYSHSKVDKANWISNLNKQIAKITKNRDSLDAVHQRAVWVPDSASKQCMICKQKFSAFIRKHHCRMCGRVVCSTCSPEKADIAKLSGKSTGSGKMERVCKTCKKPVILVTGGRVMGSEKSDDIIEISSGPSTATPTDKDTKDDSGDESSETEDSDDSETEDTPVPPPRKKKQQRTIHQAEGPQSSEEQDQLSSSHGKSPIQGSKSPEQLKKKSTPPPRPSGPPPRPSYVPSIRKSTEVTNSEPKKDEPPSIEDSDQMSSKEVVKEDEEDGGKTNTTVDEPDSNTTVDEPDSNTTVDEPDSNTTIDEPDSITTMNEADSNTKPDSSTPPVTKTGSSPIDNIPQPSPRTRSGGRKELKPSNIPPPRPSSKPIVDNSMIIDNSVPSKPDPSRPGSGSKRPVPKPRRTIFKKEPQQEATTADDSTVDVHSQLEEKSNKSDTQEHGQQQVTEQENESMKQEQQMEEENQETVEEPEQEATTTPQEETKQGDDNGGIDDDHHELPLTTSNTSIDGEKDETDGVTEELSSEVQPSEVQPSEVQTSEDNSTKTKEEERPQVVKRRKQKIISGGDTPLGTSAGTDEEKQQPDTTALDLSPKMKSMRSPSTHARQRRSKFSTAPQT